MACNSKFHYSPQRNSIKTYCMPVFKDGASHTIRKISLRNKSCVATHAPYNLFLKNQKLSSLVMLRML